MQYGSVDARVYAVAGEMRNGTVRVEMEIVGTPPVALQHGMPGSAEVLVEQVSPATLALRAAGHWIAAPVSR
jgi:membrane fusion protein (multidrug efflux system)